VSDAVPGLVSLSRINRRPAWPYLVIAVVYLLLTVLTRSEFIGDTVFYVSDIQASLACPSIHHYCPELWDAGHLLWRPAGRLLTPPLLPLLCRATGGNPIMATTLLLVAVSTIATLIASLLLYAILVEETGNMKISMVLSVVFLCANANLYSLHSGTPYSSGLAWLMAAVWCARRGSRTGAARYMALAGVFEGLAVAFWLPYIVSLPALLLWSIVDTRERRLQLAAVLLLATTLSGCILFGLGARFQGVESVADLRAWIGTSGHGMKQSHNLVRAIMGLPRSFLDFGKSGTRIKQFIFKDPYASVTMGQLLEEVVWKLAVFYLALLSLAAILATEKGKQVFLVLSLAFLGDLALAEAFEAGSAERYLPLYPFLFAAAGLCLGLQRPRLARIALYALCVCMLGNVPSAWSMRIHAEQERAMQRLNPLLPLPSNSVLFVVGDDSIGHLRLNAPFHKINEAGFETASVYTPMINTAFWKRDFATRVLAIWNQGGNVWVSTRVWSERPERNWNWVEGDDPNVRWKDIVDFFKPIEHSTAASSGDGFALISQSGKNQEFLESQRN